MNYNKNRLVKTHLCMRKHCFAKQVVSCEVNKSEPLCFDLHFQMTSLEKMAYQRGYTVNTRV